MVVLLRQVLWLVFRCCFQNFGWYMCELFLATSFSPILKRWRCDVMRTVRSGIWRFLKKLLDVDMGSRCSENVGMEV